MAKQTSREAWVDRYLREELTVEEMADFEVALMDSSAMQQELETAMGLREMLLFEAEQGIGTDNLLPESLSGVSKWRHLAVAATVTLAGFSTFMFWKVSYDSAELQRQVDLLSQPRSHVLTVPVNIMRSAGGQTPDVIVQKPASLSAILLDIELGPRSLEHESLNFALVDDAGTSVIDWRAAPSADGRAEVLLNSEQVPAVRLWLQINSSDGQQLERRLLEFR
jgi:hypothetical protein